jgi:replicative DNA helicase Mcm
MESSKEVWDEFFKRYYWEEILELANQYPDTKSLWIEFGNLERFDMEVWRGNFWISLMGS